MKYKLKSRIVPDRNAKAYFALFVKFLESHGILLDYTECLFELRKIQSADLNDMKEFVMNLMQERSPREILDFSLVWMDCAYPKEISAEYRGIEHFWAEMNGKFANLCSAFREEVINA